MNLVLRFRSAVAAMSGALASEFDQLLARINIWAGKEHRADGTHDIVTVTRLVFREPTQAVEPVLLTALPEMPLGYLTITVGTTEVRVPYYAKGE